MLLPRKRLAVQCARPHRHRHALGIILLFGAAWVGSAVGSAQADSSAYRVFVTNEGSGDLSVIDPDHRTVIATWPLGKRPRGLATSPDGSRLYVAVSGSPLAAPGVDESKLPPADKTADGIAVLDTATGRLERVLAGVSDPEQLAVSRDGAVLYIASEDTGRAVIARSADGQVLAQVDVGGQPEGVAVSARLGLVGFTSEEDNTLTLLRTGTLERAARIGVGQRPRDLAFSPRGNRLYVTGENDASVTQIDAARLAVVRTTHLTGEGVRPKGILVAPDGRRLYVSTGRNGRVMVLDAATLSVLGTVTVGQRPWGMALSPDGRLLFTANGPSNDVSVVDTQTLRVIATVPVGSRPWGVAVGPAAIR